MFGEQLARNLRARSPSRGAVTSGYDNPDYETGNPEASGYFWPSLLAAIADEKIEKILALAPLRRAATQAG